MQGNKTAIFDLDHTLFDTTELKKEIVATLEKSGLKRTEAESALLTFTTPHKGNYDMLAHCEELLKEKRISSLDAVYRFLSSSFEKHLIRGAKEVLKTLRARGYRLLLLTMGFERFQNTKLTQTGLNSFFDEVHVVYRRKEEAMEKMKFPENTYFINDSQEETERVMHTYPKLKYILFNPEPTTKKSKIPSVTTLKELLDILY